MSWKILAHYSVQPVITGLRDHKNRLRQTAFYKLVQKYSEKLGFKIGAHSLRATAATNALDHQADFAKVQE